MKIEKGHYVPKELITSEAIHEAVVKCFVAAGFVKHESFGNHTESATPALSTDSKGMIIWSFRYGEPLTLQQLFTAENGLQWPDWAECVMCNNNSVYFSEHRFAGKFEFISGDSIGNAFLLATRQTKEKKVNEDLDKFIIENNGVWPVFQGDSVRLGVLAAAYFKCEFTQRSKELGFINGYRWGIEYQTNGKRPDLHDDVLVQFKHRKHGWCNTALYVHLFNRDDSAFKITDPRYKPSDTSYLNALSQNQSLTHSEEGLTHSDWYDYENQKALRLPDVGVECYRKVGINWLKTNIVAHHHDGVRAIFCDEGFSIGELGYCSVVMFKPLDHATRKAELEKKRVVDAAKANLRDFDIPAEAYGLLYELGYLRLPANKD